MGCYPTGDLQDLPPSRSAAWVIMSGIIPVWFDSVIGIFNVMLAFSPEWKNLSLSMIGAETRGFYGVFSHLWVMVLSSVLNASTTMPHSGTIKPGFDSGQVGVPCPLFFHRDSVFATACGTVAPGAMKQRFLYR